MVKFLQSDPFYRGKFTIPSIIIMSAEAAYFQLIVIDKLFSFIEIM